MGESATMTIDRAICLSSPSTGPQRLSHLIRRKVPLVITKLKNSHQASRCARGRARQVKWADPQGTAPRHWNAPC